MKKLIAVAGLTLCLTLMVGISATSGGGNTAGTSGSEDPILLEMQPGDAMSGDEVLTAHAWEGETVVYIIRNTSSVSGTLRVDIEDCCIMGDTMIAVRIGPGLSGQVTFGTSPEHVKLRPVYMPPGPWAFVITGYWSCPGGFPAGYYWDIYLDEL